MTFYVRAARRRATLGRERGASPPALCAALHLSSFLTSPQSWMLDSQVDRLAEGPEACARGVPRRVGFGQLLAGERTAVCTNAPPRWLRIEERIALRHRSATLGQPRAMAPL